MGLTVDLTHWGRVTHICVSKLTIIGSDNGLPPGRRQAIIWTNAGILLIWPLGTNFSEISIDIHTLSLKKIHFKMSSGKWRPFCLGLNVLKHINVDIEPWRLSVSGSELRFCSNIVFLNMYVVAYLILTGFVIHSSMYKTLEFRTLSHYDITSGEKYVRLEQQFPV